LPLQSGHDQVLARMGRNYTTDEYRELVTCAREVMPGVNITTDVMVGFPGETREMFAMGLEFIREMGFGRIHVFPYSRRRGTRAYYLEGQVDPQEQNRRVAAVLEVAHASIQAFHRRFCGQTLEVLVESERDPGSGLLTGLTDNYIRVLFAGPEGLVGQLAPVELTELQDEVVLGRLVSRERRHSRGTVTIN